MLKCSRMPGGGYESRREGGAPCGGPSLWSQSFLTLRCLGNCSTTFNFPSYYSSVPGTAFETFFFELVGTGLIGNTPSLGLCKARSPGHAQMKHLCAHKSAAAQGLSPVLKGKMAVSEAPGLQGQFSLETMYLRGEVRRP